MPKFHVTYEIVTPESAEQGDVDERGFEIENATLREAIEVVHATRTNRVDGVNSIDASCSRIEDAEWFTITNGMEFETGAYESRSIHMPSSVTGASRRRIAKLLGVRDY
jgi:hypothetical protein